MSNSGEIEVGDIFKIAADEENGITPPGGRDVWYKHFVVIGKTSDGSVYGCVVFDSDMNREYVEPGEEEFYLPIQAGRYSFIDHDSYLDCLELKPATEEKLLAGRVEGTLRPDDLQEAMKLVKMSRMPGDRSVASEFNNGVILHIPNGTEGQGTEGRVPVS